MRLFTVQFSIIVIDDDYDDKNFYKFCLKKKIRLVRVLRLYWRLLQNC
jgi:hypothetical protein